jgi:precorrin-4 methylase
LTPRAVKAIQEAELVFCSTSVQEKLAPLVDFSQKKVLDGYGVLFWHYGKECSQVEKTRNPRQRMSCEEYQEKQAEFAALVRQAVAKGQDVVLLSGGDPTIYGPDMWTLQELRELNPTVVPGLSAFNAANAALQARLGEVVITAPFISKEESKDTLEHFASLEDPTLVLFMPWDMEAVFSRLAAVSPADTPVAIVSNAGMRGKETLHKGTVGSFSKDLSGVDGQRSLIYMGKAVAEALAAPNLKEGQQGKYYLVGIGPGDADLVTLRALKVIQKADVIFSSDRIKERLAEVLEEKEVLGGYHRLFPYYGQNCAELKDSERRNREGMSCEEYQEKQAEFAALVRKAVAEGKTVAMLDSGDPMIYGPAAWSLVELRDLSTEVVPGLSAFNAANAALRAGVTEGKKSHSVIFASGWSVEKMAVHQSTMVLFTMRTEFKHFVESLAKHYPAETPVALVISAGYADREKTLHGTLGTILDEVGEEKLPFEYLLYVGDFLEKSVDRLN